MLADNHLKVQSFALTRKTLTQSLSFLCMVAFIILDIVSTWAAHTAGTLPSGRPPSLATQRNEMRLEQWWTDLGHTWGLRRQSTAFQRPGNGPPRILNHSAQPPPMRYAEAKRNLPEMETTHLPRYDPRFGHLEAPPHPSSARLNYDTYTGESAHIPGRNFYGRDGEDGENHPKRRRLSNPVRRPYEGPHPDAFQFVPKSPAAPAVQAAPPHPHSGLAALLTAAEHRGL